MFDLIQVRLNVEKRFELSVGLDISHSSWMGTIKWQGISPIDMAVSKKIKWISCENSFWKMEKYISNETIFKSPVDCLSF